MTDNVVQLRDFQNPKDLERLRQALEREAAEIMGEVLIQSTTEQAASGLPSPKHRA